MGEACDVERVKGLLAEAGFTRLQADYLDRDYDPQREGWRIHDMPADKPAAYHICDGLEKEAAQAFVAAVNALPALLARIAELEEALGRIADGDVPRPIRTRWRADNKPSKLDVCPHEIPLSQDCGNCIGDFARATLEEGEGK